MILFKCTKCGAVMDAQDEYAGCQAACTYCGTEQQIPAESDPSCVLVFTESSPATGTPMTAAELHVRIEEGTVRPSDLIWAEGMWQPLNAVFELPDQGNDGDLREDIPELATAFEELSPVSGAEKLPRLRRKKGHPAGDPAIAARGAEAGPKATGLRRYSQTAAAVLVLLIGFFCALKVVNASLGRTATLVVRNGTGDRVAVTLPGGKKANIPPDGHTVAGEIAVAVHGGHRLSYVAAAEGAVPETMNVTLAPKCVTVAGLGEAQFMLLTADFVPAGLAQRTEEACQGLKRQLAAGESPLALNQFYARLDQFLKESLVEYSPLHCFTEKDYRLDFYLANTTASVHPFKPAGDGDRRQILLPPTGATFQVQNDKFTFNAELKLTAATVSVKGLNMILFDKLAAGGDATLTFARDARNDVTATLLMARKENFSHGGRSLAGQWCLKASCTNGAWQWRWELVEGASAQGRTLLVVSPGQPPRFP